MTDYIQNYCWLYRTPDGFDDLVMESGGDTLTAVWFDGSHRRTRYDKDRKETCLPVFRECADWLDSYFAGCPNQILPRMTILNPTPFRSEVLELLKEIPYGETTTYGKLAEILAEKRGIAKMSAQAVGGAVGWNPLCILIPCHRVIGADGSLTGYGGGLNNKKQLLKHERQDQKKTDREAILYRSPI